MIIFLTLLFPSICFAGWTKEDSTLQAIYTIEHLVDWAQTREIAKKPDLYTETNFMLGKHPTTSDVDKFLAITLMAHTYIAYKLPKSCRKMWQMFWIGVEIEAIKNNYKAGIKIKF